MPGNLFARISVLFCCICLTLLPIHPTVAQDNPSVYTVCDGTYSFVPPVDWAIDETTIQSVAFNPRTQAMEPQVATVITLIHDATSIDFRLQPYEDPFVLAENLVIRPPVGASYGDIETITLFGYQAVRLPVTIETEDTTQYGANLIGILDADTGIWVRIRSDDADLSTADALALDVLDTLVYTPADPTTALYADPECSFRVRYPANWRVQRIEGEVFIYNSADAQLYQQRDLTYTAEHLVMRILPPDDLAIYLSVVEDLDLLDPQQMVRTYGTLRELTLFDDARVIDLSASEAEIWQADIASGAVLLIVEPDPEAETSRYTLIHVESGFGGYQNYRDAVYEIVATMQTR